MSRKVPYGYGDTYFDQEGKEITQALFDLPVLSPERNKLRDVVKGDNDSLARRARKFLTLGAVYAERERLEKERADDAKTTPYRKWLSSVGITGKDQTALIEKTKGWYQS
jgi:hypothetical protein